MYCWWLLLLDSDIYVAGVKGRPKGLNTGFRDTSADAAEQRRVWLACASTRARQPNAEGDMGQSLVVSYLSVVYLDQPKDLPLVHGETSLFPDARAYKRRLLSLLTLVGPPFSEIRSPTQPWSPHTGGAMLGTRVAGKVVLIAVLI